MSSKRKISDSVLKKVLEEIMEGRITQSLLGDDLYKNIMYLFASVMGYENIETIWKFTNRTKSIPLCDHLTVEALEKEFTHFRNLPLFKKEEEFLRTGIPHFSNKPGMNKYINIFKTEKMPDVSIDLSGDQPDIQWGKGSKWIPSGRLEIPSLQIVTGLYYRSLFYAMTPDERLLTLRKAMDKLYDDIALLKANPDVKIIIFSNRRVLLPWLRLVCAILLSEVPNQILGISNVQVAMENGVTPKGTIAHEMHMVLTALAFDGTEESVKNANVKLATDWVDFFGTELSVILADTYTTQKTIEWYPKELVARHSAARIDSKNPDIGIPEIHRWFESCGAQPNTKVAIPSDGLSIPESVRLFNQHRSSGLVIPAPGTLVGDLGLPKGSFVSKVAYANGKSCVKTSDNIGKKIGDDADLYIRVLNLHQTDNTTPVV